MIDGYRVGNESYQLQTINLRLNKNVLNKTVKTRPNTSLGNHNVEIGEKNIKSRAIRNLNFSQDQSADNSGINVLNQFMQRMTPRFEIFSSQSQRDPEEGELRQFSFNKTSRMKNTSISPQTERNKRQNSHSDIRKVLGLQLVTNIRSSKDSFAEENAQLSYPSRDFLKDFSIDKREGYPHFKNTIEGQQSSINAHFIDERQYNFIQILDSQQKEEIDNNGRNLKRKALKLAEQKQKIDENELKRKLQLYQRLEQNVERKKIQNQQFVEINQPLEEVFFIGNPESPNLYPIEGFRPETKSPENIKLSPRVNCTINCISPQLLSSVNIQSLFPKNQKEQKFLHNTIDASPMSNQSKGFKNEYQLNRTINTTRAGGSHERRKFISPFIQVFQNKLEKEGTRGKEASTSRALEKLNMTSQQIHQVKVQQEEISGLLLRKIDIIHSGKTKKSEKPQSKIYDPELSETIRATNDFSFNPIEKQDDTNQNVNFAAVGNRQLQQQIMRQQQQQFQTQNPYFQKNEFYPHQQPYQTSHNKQPITTATVNFFRNTGHPKPINPNMANQLIYNIPKVQLNGNILQQILQNDTGVYYGVYQTNSDAFPVSKSKQSLSRSPNESSGKKINEDRFSQFNDTIKENSFQFIDSNVQQTEQTSKNQLFHLFPLTQRKNRLKTAIQNQNLEALQKDRLSPSQLTFGQKVIAMMVPMPPQNDALEINGHKQYFENKIPFMYDFSKELEQKTSNERRDMFFTDDQRIKLNLKQTVQNFHSNDKGRNPHQNGMLMIKKGDLNDINGWQKSQQTEFFPNDIIDYEF